MFINVALIELELGEILLIAIWVQLPSPEHLCALRSARRGKESTEKSEGDGEVMKPILNP